MKAKPCMKLRPKARDSPAGARGPPDLCWTLITSI